MPRPALLANLYLLQPEHAQLPLVIMLTLTQLAVGAVVVDLVLGRVLGTLATATLGFGCIVLPLALAWGTTGVTRGHRMAWVCSVMVYAATGRDHWRGSLTGMKFGLTTLVLGVATVLMVSTVAALVGASGDGPVSFAATPPFRQLGAALGLASGIKMAFELSILRRVRDPHHSVLKRGPLLMVLDLKRVTLARFICGILGGLALPSLALVISRSVTSSLANPSLRPGFMEAGAPLGTLVILIFVLSVAGELCERYLFFAAAPSSRMPAGLV